MRIRFRAINCVFAAGQGVLICGMEGLDPDGVERSLGIQRISEEAAADTPDDDWGAHIMLDDQVNGDYNRVARIRLTRGLLAVDLSEQLGSLVGVEGFDVALDLSDEDHHDLGIVLARIFRGQSVLSINPTD